MNQSYIYILFRQSEPNLYLYVGWSINPLKRFCKHIRDAKLGKHKLPIVNAVNDSDIDYKVIDVCYYETKYGRDSVHLEAEWWLKLKRDGHPLCNPYPVKSVFESIITQDGNISVVRKKISWQQRKNMSDAHKGQVPWNKNRKASKETRKKLSDSHKGKSPLNKTQLANTDIDKMQELRNLGKTGKEISEITGFPKHTVYRNTIVNKLNKD